MLGAILDKGEVGARKTWESTINIHPNQSSDNVAVQFKSGSNHSYKLQVLKIYSIFYARHGFLTNEYNLYETTVPPGQYRVRVLSESKIALSFSVELGGSKDRINSITDKPFLSKIMQVTTKDEKLYDGKVKVSMKIQNQTSKESRFEVQILQGYGYDEIKQVEDSEKSTEKEGLVMMMDDSFVKKDKENLLLIIEIAKKKEFISVQGYGLKKLSILEKNEQLLTEYHDIVSTSDSKRAKHHIGLLQLFQGDNPTFDLKKEISELVAMIEQVELDNSLILDLEKLLPSNDVKYMETTQNRVKDMISTFKKSCSSKLQDTMTKISSKISKIKKIEQDVQNVLLLIKSSQDYRPIADLIDELEESPFAHLFDKEIKLGKQQVEFLQKKENLIEELNEMLIDLKISDGPKLSNFLHEYEKYIPKELVKEAQETFRNLEKKSKGEIVDQKPTAIQRNMSVGKNFDELKRELHGEVKVETPIQDSEPDLAISPLNCTLEAESLQTFVETDLVMRLMARNGANQVVETEIKSLFKLRLVDGPDGVTPSIRVKSKDQPLGTMQIIFSSAVVGVYYLSVNLKGEDGEEEEIEGSPFEIIIRDRPIQKIETPVPEPVKVEEPVMPFVEPIVVPSPEKTSNDDTKVETSIDETITPLQGRRRRNIVIPTQLTPIPITTPITKTPIQTPVIMQPSPLPIKEEIREIPPIDTPIITVSPRQSPQVSPRRSPRTIVEEEPKPSTPPVELVYVEPVSVEVVQILTQPELVIEPKEEISTPIIFTPTDETSPLPTLIIPQNPTIQAIKEDFKDIHLTPINSRPSSPFAKISNKTVSAKIEKHLEKNIEEQKMSEIVNRAMSNRQHEFSHELLNIFHSNLIKVIYGNQNVVITRKTQYAKGLVDSLITILNYKKKLKFFWQEVPIIDIFEAFKIPPVQNALNYFKNKNIAQITKFQDVSTTWVQFILETGDLVSFIKMFLINPTFLMDYYESDSIMLASIHQDDWMCNLELLTQLKFSLGYIPQPLNKEKLDLSAKNDMHKIGAICKTVIKFFIIKRQEKVSLESIANDFVDGNVVGDLVRTRLCPLVESVCHHGTKIKSIEGRWTIMEILEAIHFKCENEFVRKTITQLNFVEGSESVKFKSLVCLLLNFGQLGEFVKMLSSREYVDRFYEKESLWSDSVKVKELFEYFDGISKLTFRLDIEKIKN